MKSAIITLLLSIYFLPVNSIMPGFSTSDVIIIFEYDDVGNRTARNYTLGVTFKAAQLDTDEKDKNVEMDRQLDVLIYPNPTEREVKIYFENLVEPGIMTISIYDLNGKRVFMSNFAVNPIEIDMSEKPSGIYIISISDGNNTITERIIKK